MIEDRFISPRQLARAIGASESSLKRWVDSGRVAVSRTAGGHRRINVREAIRFIRESGHELVNPDALGIALLHPEEGPIHTGPRSGDALEEALVEGDAEAGRRIILSRYLAGEPVANLCDGPVAQALRVVGALYQHRDDGIFIEHRTTFLALKALMQLRALLPAVPLEGPVAVGGTVAGDPHLVGTSMVSLIMTAEGWRETNLGANTPVSAFCQAIHAHRPDLLWISFSLRESAERFVRDWEEILDLAGQRKITVVVGGQAFPVKAAAPYSSRIHHLPNMQALAGFVRGLRLSRQNREFRKHSAGERKR